eukprot:UN06981
MLNAVKQSSNKRPSSVKWVYCPDNEYKKFLAESKPVLKEKIKNHLLEREAAVFKATTEVIIELNDVCKQSTPHTTIICYTQSLIHDNRITKLIDMLVDEWEGPIYGNRLITQLNGNEVNVEIIDFKTFRDRAINWMQQSSHKVTGPFFAR